MKKIFFILILFINLFADKQIINDLISISAEPLYNLDKNILIKSIKPYLKIHKNIKAIKILDTTDHSTFLQCVNDKNIKCINTTLNDFNDYIKLSKDINYDNETIGKIIVFIQNNNFIYLTPHEKNWIQNHTLTFGVENLKPHKPKRSNRWTLRGFY